MWILTAQGNLTLHHNQTGQEMATEGLAVPFSFKSVMENKGHSKILLSYLPVVCTERKPMQTMFSTSGRELSYIHTYFQRRCSLTGPAANICSVHLHDIAHLSSIRPSSWSQDRVLPAPTEWLCFCTNFAQSELRPFPFSFTISPIWPLSLGLASPWGLPWMPWPEDTDHGPSSYQHWPSNPQNICRFLLTPSPLPQPELHKTENCPGCGYSHPFKECNPEHMPTPQTPIKWTVRCRLMVSSHLRFYPKR
jgi:hypothetical protein